MLEGFDDDGTPRTRPPRRAITLRHLLTHTAGFSYEIWSDAIVRYQEATGTPGVMGCENATLATPLLFDPGDRWDYGINIDWAGKLVEAVSGQRLGDYLREHLLGPLGMSDTAFRITDEMRGRGLPIPTSGSTRRRASAAPTSLRCCPSSTSNPFPSTWHSSGPHTRRSPEARIPRQALTGGPDT